MKILTDFDYNPGLSLAFGFFDGVHLGHRCVIKNAVNFAVQNKLKSAVVTFRESPKNFFSNTKNPQLVSIKTRLELIKKIGVDFVYLLDFDDQIASLTAREYLDQKIIKYFEPKAITTGFNHTLGMDCATSRFLTAIQKAYKFKYFEIPPITWKNELVSTTEIKKRIVEGDFQKANNLLGYEFFVEGNVIPGNKIGRTMAFPTANIKHPEGIVDFPFGVYLAKTVVRGQVYNGVLNFGIKPTIDDTNRPLHEIHIFDFSDNIYGEKIKIIPIKQIRKEQKFDSIDDLKKQIIQDAIAAKSYFG